MLMVVSPAKALDESHDKTPINFTKAEFLDEAETLVSYLKEMSPHDISDLMSLSDKLSELNYDRYQAWSLPMKDHEAYPAGYLFKGDVYQGLDIRTLEKKEVSYLQSHLRILSGLYGVLKPMDAILPYRLEMGTHLKTAKGKNLYEFWGDQLVNTLNQQLENSGSRVLVNLASNEYFKAVGKKKLDADLITPQFKDWKNGQYKMISFYAKKARGLMARYAAKNQIEQVEDLKYFDLDGYAFAPDLSNEKDWVFTRKSD